MIANSHYTLLQNNVSIDILNPLKGYSKHIDTHNTGTLYALQSIANNLYMPQERSLRPCYLGFSTNTEAPNFTDNKLKETEVYFTDSAYSGNKRFSITNRNLYQDLNTLTYILELGFYIPSNLVFAQQTTISSIGLYGTETGDTLWAGVALGNDKFQKSTAGTVVEIKWNIQIRLE